MLVSSDWAQIVATAPVPNRGPASVARLYEVGANSTVHRVHEFTFDQFTVRILRLVHFLFSFIFANLWDFFGFCEPHFHQTLSSQKSSLRSISTMAVLPGACRPHSKLGYTSPAAAFVAKRKHPVSS